MFIHHEVIGDTQQPELKLNIDYFSTSKDEEVLPLRKTTIQEYIRNYINDKALEFEGNNVKVISGNVVVAEVILKNTSPSNVSIK